MLADVLPHIVTATPHKHHLLPHQPINEALLKLWADMAGHFLTSIGGLTAVGLSLVLFFSGIYLQRAGRLQTQQGAEAFALFGVVVGAIERLQANGLPVTLEGICAATSALENVSVTDTKNAILAHTRDVGLPLTGWLSLGKCKN